VFGCSSEGSTVGKGGGRDAASERAWPAIVSSGDGATTYAPTFTAIYDEILGPFCANMCHMSSEQFYLIIVSKEGAFDALVNAPAAGPNCAPTGLKRVEPGHPETSLLYLKVTSPPCGSKMPLLYGDASGSLDPQQIEQIRQWIEAGAPNN
jgi:hypothetical protein